MNVKETFEWKSIAVICIALLMTLVTVMTASGGINSGVPDNTGINTYWGSNVTENVTMYDTTSNFLNFTLNDSQGNITWLNLTFPGGFSLPVNTTLNYSLTGFVGLDATNITVIGQTINIANGTPTNDIWNTTNGSPAHFSINITNITFTGSPGPYEINATTNKTPDGKLVYLTVGGDPTVSPITFNQSVNTWVTNNTMLEFNASISDIGSGVNNATINITSLNSTAGIINLNWITGDIWGNNSFMVRASQEGRHNITIVSYDNASQVNNTVNFSVWVDNTGPIVVANNYTAVPTWVNNNTLLMLNASIVDPLSGPYNATVNALAVNGSLTSAIILEHAGGDYWTNYTAAIVNIANQGQINLTITAYDNVSLSNSSVNFSVWVDNLNPIVTPITYSGAQMWVNNGTVLNLNMSVTDQGVVGVNASGVDSSQSYINVSYVNSTQTAILTNSDIYWENTTIIVDTANTGQVNLTITVTDNATNVNSSVNFTMWVDNIKPEVTNLTATYPNGQTAVKINATVTLNATVTDAGGSDVNVSSIMVNLSLLNSSLDWVQFDTYLGNNNWSLTAFVNNSSTSTINLPVKASDNATNINSTETIQVVLDNTPPMFNGTNPIVAMTWDGSATANATEFYYYYDNTTATPTNITIQVNMTESGLTVWANFTEVDGNTTLAYFTSSTNVYNITHPIGNSANGNTSAGYVRTIIISAMDGASNINMSTGGQAPYNGPAPFVAVINITPQMFNPTLGGSTTNWTTDIDDFTNVVGLTFENVSNGKINFTGSVNLCDLTTVTALQSLSTNMQIASGNMSLNAAANALAAMNVSSNLTMYDLSQFTSQPGIMMDGVPIVDSGQTSGGSVVSNLEWNASGGHNLTFSVTHWTSYQADGGKPFVIPLSPLGTTWLKNGSILNLNATVTDAISGVKNATVNVSDVNATGVAELGFDGSFWTNISLIVATSNEGIFNLTITAYDNVSNMNNSANLTVKIDVTAPEVTNLSAGYTSSASAVKRGGYVILNLTAVDPGTYSGLNTSSIQVNLSLINDTFGWTDFNPAVGNNNWTYTVLVNNSTTGTINLPVRASDNATNANASEVIPVILDNTPPNASTITYPSNGQVLQAMSTWVNGTTNDDASNVTIYVNGNVTNASVIVIGNAYNVSNVPLAGEGSHTINVSSYDVLGNVNATNASVTVLVDTVDPIITMVTPNASSVAYKQGGALLYVNFTYAETSPMNYTVVISNATTTINTSTSASVGASPVSVGFTLNSTAAEGAYNVTVTMYDNSSRVNTSIGLGAVVVDNAAPIFTSVLTHTDDAPSDYDNDDSIDLSWTAASDALSSVTYTIYKDGVLNASTTSTSYTISGVADGTYTFNVSAVDAAGNVNTTNLSASIMVDTVDPVISNLSLSTISPSSYGESIIVTVNVSDVGGSGMSAVAAAGVSLTHQSGDMWNGTISAVYGTNTVIVIATDNASKSVTNTSLSYTGPTAPTTSSDDSGSVGSRTLLQTPTTEDTEGVVVLSQESKGIALSEPATTIAVDFTKEDIMSIEVEAKVEVSSVYITVQKLDGKPTSIPQSLSGSVHSYLNINVKDIDEDNIAGANIAFKVEKKWLSQNNIAKDNVMLARFSEGVWQQLETTVLNGDDDFVHFSARTPGFSTFAIVAKDVAVTEPVDEVETPVSVEDPAPEVVTETPAPEEEDNGLPGFEAIFAVMGLFLVTLLVRKQEKN